MKKFVKPEMELLLLSDVDIMTSSPSGELQSVVKSSSGTPHETTTTTDALITGITPTSLGLNGDSQ